MAENVEASTRQCIVIKKLSPKTGAKQQILGTLEIVAMSLEQGSKAGSFWVLQRDNIAEDGNDVVIFARFDSKEDYVSILEGSEPWKRADQLCDKVTVTLWKGTGIGFLERWPNPPQLPKH